MKYILFIIGLIISPIKSEYTSSLDAWENILQTPELLTYFNGVFEHLGVTIEETGEQFTIHQLDSKFVFEDGIIEEDVDFIVPLRLENIENMMMHAKDGEISALESWRILDVLFTPLTKVTLQNPVLSVNWRRKLAGVEDLTHVYLLNPNGGEASKHTLIYIKGQWLVLKGIYGNPRRTYRMTPEDSLEYQRTIFKALKQDSLFGWFKFSRWYKKWRKNVSITH
tara:strand:- start:435 stop:1106 length:672 start_codon:yes stop_codon:yes gene_type:complete